MRPLSTEYINHFIETQLLSWGLAKESFDRLALTERKLLRLGYLESAAQLNAARIRSTGASVDKESIARRPCFLCKSNRPLQQITVDWPSKDWELVINPYPILPVHFCIVSKNHTPQAEIPLDMASMAENAPSLAFFYNGARAGASAPDHLHCQAVLKDELPIVKLAERYHKSSSRGWHSSEEFGIDLPFHFMSCVVGPDMNGMICLSKTQSAFGIDSETGEHDKGLLNAFFWISNDGLLRIVIVPRRAHRPSLYFLPEGERFVISPGAIDMAGILIVPRSDDFQRITPAVASRRYAETSFADSLPQEIKDHFIASHN